MADISANFLGIKSPNPFWLASAPPTDKKINVLRAFEAGWGGVVWKTLGSQVKNVSSRYSAVDFGGQRVMGFNNIELITDRRLSDNLREMEEVKKQLEFCRTELFRLNIEIAEIEDILEDFITPLRDPRDKAEAPVLRSDVLMLC